MLTMIVTYLLKLTALCERVRKATCNFRILVHFWLWKRGTLIQLPLDMLLPRDYQTFFISESMDVMRDFIGNILKQR